jgi:predicted alpha/beta-hydrolase family hydrolase
MTPTGVHEVTTDQGLARLHRFAPGTRTPQRDPEIAAGTARGTLLLGHGAGGGVETADLAALTSLTDRGWEVVLLEQPWRVAGRRVAVAPSRLDAATAQMLQALPHITEAPRPWVLGGRSAGARVACRLRGHAQALCLVAFPLRPPQRGARTPTPRTEELAAPIREGVPTLVLQGLRDRFGSPEDLVRAVSTAVETGPGAGGAGESLRVHGYPGDHGPSRDLDIVRREVAAFLDALP